jgi:serine/threonine protein kinase/tetratricopeptide (TPR) repeat protein
MNIIEDKARSIFLAAVERHSPDQWSVYLDKACGDDKALRSRVEALLRGHAAPDSLFDQSDPRLFATIDQPALTERPGAVIGPYKLLEQIGEGGFGIVFMAEQQEPIRRKVALKVLKPGMDTRQVIARFEAERQALALMDHPNIAQVLDAGQTVNDRPYFVMELVRGVPITDFCDHGRLNVHERLGLFVDLCQAVQHAHQKGVIHRDLKPSNVLVTLHDDRAVVKVIDFGVAKALAQPLTEKTLFTNFAQMIGTPLYMSPEQAQMSGLDVDTRSDVYSLGVLLYELLTGTTPFDQARLRGADLDEIRRIIREEEPAKPSTRLSTLGRAASTASANRQSDPRRLSQLFRGELDWIVLKALEKDRNRRYESASAFAADVQRYLADEPVLACPPSVGYRLRKFVRRNKGPVLAASAIVVLLMAGIMGTSTGLVWALAAESAAVEQRDQKEKALEQVVRESDEKEKALRQVGRERDEKEKARRRAVSEGEEKEKARKQALAAVELEAQWRRHTRRALNMMTDEVVEELLGKQVQLTDRHREFLNKVLAYHREFAAAKRPGNEADDPDGRHSRAEGYYRVALIRLQLGELKDAESAYREALALLEQLTAQFPKRPGCREDLAITCNNLGILLRKTGGSKEAESCYRRVLALQNELATDFPGRPNIRRDTARTYSNLGNILSDMGRLPEAEKAYRDSLDILKQLAVEFPNRIDLHQALAGGNLELGTILSETGRPTEAEVCYREALVVLKKPAAEFSNRPDLRENLARTYNNLGNVLRATDRPTEAESAYRDALPIWKELAAIYFRPDFRQGVALTQNNLGMLLHASGRWKEAEAVLGEALILGKSLTNDFSGRPDFRQDLARSLFCLGNLLSETRRPKEAEAAYRDALTIQKPLALTFPDRPDFRLDLALTHDNLGDLFFSTGRLPQAETAWRDAQAALKQLVAQFPGRPDFCRALGERYNKHGGLLCERGRLKEGEAEYREALGFWKQLAAEFPNRAEFRQELARSQNNLGLALRNSSQPSEAETAYRGALTLRKKLVAEFPDRPDYRQDLARSHYSLGIVLRSTRQPKEAEAAYREALALRKQLVADFPDRTDFRQELAASQETLANLLRDTGRHKEAEAHYRDALDFYKKQPAGMLTRADWASGRFRSDMAGCYNNFGILLRVTNRPKEAHAAYREALALQKQLAADFPAIPDHQNALAATLSNLAILELQSGQFTAGLALLDQAQPHLQAALKASPKKPAYRRCYRNSLLVTAECHANLGDHARVAATADVLARLAYDPAIDTYYAAGYLCHCVKLVDKDTKLDKVKSKALSQSYADRALELLRQAVALGFLNVSRLKQDPNLEPLRTREEFRQLLAEVERKKK